MKVWVKCTAVVQPRRGMGKDHHLGYTEIDSNDDLSLDDARRRFMYWADLIGDPDQINVEVLDQVPNSERTYIFQ